MTHMFILLIPNELGISFFFFKNIVSAICLIFL